MIKYFTLILFLIVQFSLFSQTFVDALNVNGKWTKAESPYLINSDIIVASNDSLIVEPGVQIIFLDYYLFQVFGHFSAIGAENDSIYFTVADTTGYSTSTHAGWGGLDLASYNDTVLLNYCVLEFSQESGIFCTDGIGFSINNSCIRFNDYDGVAVANVHMSMDQVRIYSNKNIGIHDYFGSPGSISNFEIFNNTGRGISTSNYSSSDIFNGIVSNNNGGGIAIGYESWPNINNVIIENNGSLEIDGGGIYASGGCYLDNLTVQNNIANYGGGIASFIFGFEDMHLSNSVIEDNIAINEGGGVYHNGETLILSDNLISNNQANIGGGIAFQSSTIEMALINSIIKNNSAIQNGGGIYINGNYMGICTIENVEISSNEAGYFGGGIYNLSLYDFETYCNKLTTVSNIAGQSGGGLYCSLTDSLVNFENSIFWDNSPDEIVDTSGKLKITYSNIKGGYTKSGNINSDPLFSDPVNGNYQLSWLNYPLEDYTKSPCIGTGSEGEVMGAYVFDNSSYELNMPIINNIIDVPNDQGKQVVINWTGSILDANSGSIDKYTIWRKQNWAKEPWEYMGETPAQYFEEYAFIAPTIMDSTAIGIPFFTYMIAAVDTDSSLYYYSYPDSGYSVDNIAPVVPTNFAGTYNQDTVKLSWEESPDEDFSYYSLYRSDDPSNFPILPIATIENIYFYDVDLVIDTLYYLLTATDVNGNESVTTNELEIMVPSEVILDLKVYLEGAYLLSGMMNTLNLYELIPLDQPYTGSPWFYSGIESVSEIINLNIVDWMLVELKDATTVQEAINSESIGGMAVFVLNNGNLISHDQLSFPRIESKIENNLFVVLHHRNHLSIVSNIPVYPVDDVYTYNFTTGADKVFGGTSAVKEISTNVWGMIAGDGNGDGTIDNQDKNDVWFFQENSFGYLSGDYNMDSQVDQDDKIIMWKTNVGKGVIVSDSILE